MKTICLILAYLLSLLTFQLLATPTFAIVDPLSAPNNKFGIHIISATKDEIEPAAKLVNSAGGDWGYITVIVQSKDRDHDKWQKFFDDLRDEHLIPIVRLATEPDGANWKRPYDGEEDAWADFLNNLNWPTENRYVVVYNEPNHANEWGGTVDPKNYADTLNKTIDALKKRSGDFFVINAGFDTASPNEPPNYMDELVYMQEMNKEVPGIFDKLDGWDSHSYPFAFIGPPDANGRGTVRTWLWELQALRSLGAAKNLPVFITETGWKHAEGISYEKNLPTADTISYYYVSAFNNAWSSNRIVAVTPFLLNYQDAPFDHFSFKKVTGEAQNDKILGASYPDYYDSYDKIAQINKLTGYPAQENKAELTKGEIYSSLVTDQSYTIPITFKNTGQSIWNERSSVKLMATSGGKELNIQDSQIPNDTKIEPGQEYTFNLKLKAPDDGKYNVKLALYFGNSQYPDKTWDFSTEVKSPVMLKIQANLKWKKDSSGDYILSVKGAAGNTDHTVTLSDAGLSEELEARYLLPGYKFEFTLTKPYYQTVTVNQLVVSGDNAINFGTLQPDFTSALLNPPQLWKLTPFLNN